MRRKKKRMTRRRRERIVAFAILYIIELLVGVCGGAAAAAILIPLAYWERGYLAFGGEWLGILVATYAAFSVFHNWIYEKIGG
jgi:H+/Cl- antiporter ClcA